MSSCAKKSKTPVTSNNDVLKVLELTTNRHPWLYKKTHLLCTDFAHNQEMRTTFRRHALKDIIELLHKKKAMPVEHDYITYRSSNRSGKYCLSEPFRDIYKKYIDIFYSVRYFAWKYDIKMPMRIMEGTEYEATPTGPVYVPFDEEAALFRPTWMFGCTFEENLETRMDELKEHVTDFAHTQYLFFSEMHAFIQRAFSHFKPDAFETTLMSWYPTLMEVNHMVMNGIDTPTSVDTVEPDEHTPDGYIERWSVDSDKLEYLVDQPNWKKEVIVPLPVPRRMPDGTPFLTPSFTVIH